jgi:hypothetical protein
VLGVKAFERDTLADSWGIGVECVTSFLVPSADVLAVDLSYFDSLSAMPGCEDVGGRQAPNCSCQSSIPMNRTFAVPSHASGPGFQGTKEP